MFDQKDFIRQVCGWISPFDLLEALGAVAAKDERATTISMNEMRSPGVASGNVLLIEDFTRHLLVNFEMPSDLVVNSRMVLERLFNFHPPSHAWEWLGDIHSTGIFIMDFDESLGADKPNVTFKDTPALVKLLTQPLLLMVNMAHHMAKTWNKHLLDTESMLPDTLSDTPFFSYLEQRAALYYGHSLAKKAPLFSEDTIINVRKDYIAVVSNTSLKEANLRDARRHARELWGTEIC